MGDTDVKEHVYILTEDDQERYTDAWRFPLLRVPDLEVTNIYVDKNLQATDQYEIDRNLEIIVWRGAKPCPSEIAVRFKLPKNLPSKQDREFWQKLAVILPIVAAIISPPLLEVTKYVLGNESYVQESPTAPSPQQPVGTQEEDPNILAVIPEPTVVETNSNQPNLLSPTQFMENYYALINEGEIGQAWQLLTPQFQNSQGQGEAAYTAFFDWWSSVDQVQVRDVALVEQSGSKAVVEVRVSYAKDGEIKVEEPLRYTLVWNEVTSSWQLDDRQ